MANGYNSGGNAELFVLDLETGAIIRTQEGNDGVFVYTCDAAVHSAKEVFHVQQITIIGGGGTDLTPGIEAASRRHPRPDVIVVITDGDTPWPKRGPRGIRVIVVLVGSGSAPNWAYAVIPVPIGQQIVGGCGTGNPTLPGRSFF